MKLRLVALAVCAVLQIGNAISAQPPAAANDRTAHERAIDAGQATERAWERTHRASKIIGTDVRNRQGQKIGDIKDVVLDANGQIAYTVVATGGFLGIGDRLHAIPWSALQKDGQTPHFVLDIDRERLKRAPGFDSRHWPNMADERWNTETRNYYADPQR